MELVPNIGTRFILKNSLNSYFQGDALIGNCEQTNTL